ncbi:MAG: hypothetical protein ABFS37_11745 [Acidobacteriota bacterium]
MNPRNRMIAIALAAALCSPALALDTAFTYQGRLVDAGAPANGSYDFQFILYDALVGGSQVGSIVYVDNSAAADGFFAAQLDFGAGTFAGADLWLEVAVRDGASTGAYTPLVPRQPVTATPYALHALGTPAGWTASGPDIHTTNAGNVGIGTSLPEKKLHVHGGARFTTGNIEISGGNVRIWSGDKALTFRQDSNDSFISNKEDFVGSGSGPNGRLILNGEEGVHLKVGADGSSGLDGLTVGRYGVGIRVTNPLTDLDVNGRVRIETMDGAGPGKVSVWGDQNVPIGQLSATADRGQMFVSDSDGSWEAKVYVDENGDGIVSADVKNFVSPNPFDPREDIWYACVEGPEAAMYVRGTERLVDGRATVDLPDHFRDLAAETGLTVQLTPRTFDSLGLGAEVRGLDVVEVGELHGGRGNYDFDWEVKAVRRAHQDFRVTRPWTEGAVHPDTDLNELWAARLESIERREQRIQEMEERLAEDREAATD